MNTHRDREGGGVQPPGEGQTPPLQDSGGPGKIKVVFVGETTKTDAASREAARFFKDVAADEGCLSDFFVASTGIKSLTFGDDIQGAHYLVSMRPDDAGFSNDLRDKMHAHGAHGAGVVLMEQDLRIGFEDGVAEGDLPTQEVDSQLQDSVRFDWDKFSTLISGILNFENAKKLME